MTIPLTLDAMIDEEDLRFEPVSGVFDPARVAAFVEGVGPCFRDPHMPGLFVLAADEATRDLFLQRRRARPEVPPPFTLLVEVSERSILVVPVNSGALAGFSRSVVGWLLETWSCRVVNGHGNEVALERHPIESGHSDQA